MRAKTGFARPRPNRASLNCSRISGNRNARTPVHHPVQTGRPSLFSKPFLFSGLRRLQLANKSSGLFSQVPLQEWFASYSIVAIDFATIGPPNMSEKTETVSFRLPATFSKELRDQAARLDESPGEYARRLVMDALTNRHQQELAELRDTVASLRDDVATAVTALLVNDGKTSPTEAEEWVRKNLHV